MSLQHSLNAFGLPGQPGFIDEKQPASPAKSPQLQQPDADRTLAPSPVSTKETAHEDEDEYPDGGARAWLIVLGVRLPCWLVWREANGVPPANRRSAWRVRRAFHSFSLLLQS